MNDLDSLLRRFPLTTGNSSNPFKLASRLEGPASDAEIVAAWGGQTLPPDLKTLWLTSRSARLFEDVEYGQWGLDLLDPKRSAARTETEKRLRSPEYRATDLIIGEFLGDQELLTFAPAETGDRKLLIALPLDPRSEWFGAGASLDEFLQKYLAAGGDKFWERRPAIQPSG